MIKTVDYIPEFESSQIRKKIEGNIFMIKNLEDKVRRLEGEQKFLCEQDDLRCRKIDDLEQYGRRECFDLMGLKLVTLKYQLIAVRLSKII